MRGSGYGIIGDVIVGLLGSFVGSYLVQALRHCDGEHVQAIVLVRDDFWIATNRFEARIAAPADYSLRKSSWVLAVCVAPT